jgi:FMN phosphatase YigB (HAD superfamily)
MLNDIRKKPEECLFIDDQENNVVMARSLGIKSLLFTNYETLFLEMKELGIAAPDALKI